jgi:molybdate transport system permease protein
VKRAFDLLLVAAATLTFAFLLLPLLALFLRTSPGSLIGAVGEPAARSALLLSLKTSAIAHAVILGVGTPVAYLLATRRFRGRNLLVALVELPLVLPPAVAGIGLLAAFGRLGLLGKSLGALGVSIPFTQTAVVLAVVFVASPFYIRQAIAGFEAVDPELVSAARTLGATPWRTFRRVWIPLAARGLGAGSALAWARGLGEFGATIMFAGSFPGVTRTMPLTIYAELDRNLDVALAIGAVLVVVSAALLVAVKMLSWRRSGSTSPSPSVPSLSSSTSA